MNTIFDHAILELTLCESSLAHLIREAEDEEENAFAVFDKALVAVAFGGSPNAYEDAGIRKRNAALLLRDLKALARTVTQMRVQIEKSTADRENNSASRLNQIR
ncbi:hypothetical protein D9M68_730540 [compost metagenome]